MSKKKKRKRRVDRNELRQMVAPTEDFEYVNPHDEEDIIIVTAQRLSPGHLFQIDSSSLLKAYQEKPEDLNPEEIQNNEGVDESKLQEDILENFDKIVNDVKYASELTSLAIVDPETGKNIYTKEDCLLYFSPEFNTKISNWALAGANPQQKGESGDSVDRFPSGVNEQEGSELAQEAE